MVDDLRTWVVDSSSLIQIRQAGMSAPRQKAVFDVLTRQVRAGQLIFPLQVLEELEWNEASRPGDQAREWARRVRPDAERAADMNTVRRVLQRAPELLDPDSPRDQADPYVIALALDCQAIGGVSILSDDRVDRSDGKGGIRKLSVYTAAGLWDIPVVPLAGFVRRFLDVP